MSAKKKRLGSRRRLADQSETNTDFGITDTTSVAQCHIPEERTASLNATADLHEAQCETQPPPSPDLLGNRRKLGSSRRSRVQPNPEPTEEVEPSRRGAALQPERQADVLPDCASEAPHATVTKHSEVDLESFGSMSEKETPSEGTSNACSFEEATQEAKKSDLCHTDEVNVGVGVSEFAGVVSCETDQQLIESSSGKEIVEEKLPNVGSVTEKPSDDETEMFTTESINGAENTEIESSLQQGTVSSPKGEMPAEVAQHEHLNSPEVAQARHSEDAVNKVHESEITLMGMRQIAYSSESETSQAELIEKNVHDFPNNQSISIPDSKPDEHPEKEQLEDLLLKSDNDHVYDTRKPRSSDIEGDDTVLGQVFEVEDTVHEQDVEPAENQEKHQIDFSFEKVTHDATDNSEIIPRNLMNQDGNLRDTNFRFTPDEEHPNVCSVTEKENIEGDEDTEWLRQDGNLPDTYLLSEDMESSFPPEKTREEQSSRERTGPECSGQLDIMSPLKEEVHTNEGQDDNSNSPEVTGDDRSEDAVVKVHEQDVESREDQEKPQIDFSFEKVTHDATDNSEIIPRNLMNQIEVSDSHQSKMAVTNTDDSSISLEESSSSLQTHQSEINVPLDPQLQQTIGHRRKMGSRRENKGRLHVNDSGAESDQEPSVDVVGNTRDNETQEDTGETEVQEKSIETLMKETDQFDTAHTEGVSDQVNENALDDTPVGIADLTSLGLQSSLTAGHLEIDQSNFSFTPDEEPPNVCSVTEKENNEGDEDTEWLRQDGNLRDTYLLSEDMEPSFPPEKTREEQSSRERTGPECSGQLDIMSPLKEEVHTNEGQDDNFNSPEVTGDDHSEDAVVKVHEQDVESREDQEKPQIDFSSEKVTHDATDNSEINPRNLMNQIEVSDTHQSMMAVTNTDDSSISLEESSSSLQTHQSEINVPLDPQLQQTIGHRRKMGSRRKNKGRLHVKDSGAESDQEPSVDVVGNTRDNETQEDAEMALKIEPTENLEKPQMDFSFEKVTHDAKDNSEIIPGNLMNQIEVSDTPQSMMAMTNTDDSLINLDNSNPDNTQEEHPKEENYFETSDQTNEDYDVCDTRKTQISEIERVDTCQVFEGDTNPSVDQTAFQEKEELLEESSSSLQTHQSEINVPLDPQLQQTTTSFHSIGHRRKMGSRRENKGQLHVKDSGAESDQEPSVDVVGNTRDNETQEDTEETEVQEKSIETLMKETDQFDTAHTEGVSDQVNVNALDDTPVGIADLTSLGLQSSLTAGHLEIDQSNFSFTPDEKPPNVCSVTGKENIEGDEDTEWLRQDGNLRDTYLLSEDMESSFPPEKTREEQSSRERTGPECSGQLDIMSPLKEEVHTNEGQDDNSNSPEVTGDDHSEDAVVKVHEQDVESREDQEKPQIDFSFEKVTHDATDNSEINPRNLMNQIEVSDTHQSMMAMTNTDDSSISLEESSSSLQTHQSDFNVPLDPQLQQTIGHRRKMGSRRKNKGRLHVKDSGAESDQEPSVDVVGNTRDNETQEDTEMALKIEPTENLEKPQMDFSFEKVTHDAKDNSEIIPVNLMNQIEVSDTPQSMMAMTNTDDSLINLDNSNPDNTQQEHPKEENYFETSDQTNEDCDVCDTRKTQISDIERVDTCQVFEGDTNPSVDQTAFQEKEELLEESSSSLQTHQSDFNVPLDPQLQQTIGHRRKMGSRRKNKGRLHVKDSGAESDQEPSVDVVGNTRDNETQEDTEINSLSNSLVVLSHVKSEDNKSSFALEISPEGSPEEPNESECTVQQADLSAKQPVNFPHVTGTSQDSVNQKEHESQEMNVSKEMPKVELFSAPQILATCDVGLKQAETAADVPEQSGTSGPQGMQENNNSDDIVILHGRSTQKRRKMGSTRQSQFNGKRREERAETQEGDTETDTRNRVRAEPVEELTTSATAEWVSQSENANLPLGVVCAEQQETHESSAVNPEEIPSSEALPPEQSASIHEEVVDPLEFVHAADVKLHEGSAAVSGEPRNGGTGAASVTPTDEQRVGPVDIEQRRAVISTEAPVVADLETVTSGGEGEAAEEHVATRAMEPQTDSAEEAAHRANPQVKNASPCLEPKDRRRKMGSTRKNLRTGTKQEDSHQTQGETHKVTETAADVADVKTESFPSAIKDERHVDTGDRDGGPETSEHSRASESHKAPAHQMSEEKPVSQGRMLVTEHRVTPSYVPAEPSTPPKDGSMSESAFRGRRRKMGSNRKSQGHQSHDNQTARVDQRKDTENESDVRSIREENAIHTEELREESSTTKVDQRHGKQLSNLSSSKGEDHHARPVSEKTPEPVTAAQHNAAGIQSHGSPQRFSLDDRPDLRSKAYNVMMIGDSSVGKSSFMKRAQSGKFSLDLPPSVGLDSCMWTVLVEGKPVVLQLWDTAGQERFHSLTKQTFHKAHAFLLMYDITCSQSFSSVSYWESCIREASAESVTILLVGNKSDGAERQVKTQEAEILATEYRFEFMECSAATGENVVQCLETMARMLSEKDETSEVNMVLHKEPPKKTSRCC
ncbi:uncharacterized protein rab44 isoform X2 [Pungitius pungitius]|uniref:uncharacterized protein rab44 isoform X2 n=1 Tax=Pungitius pungitius TaxID=134920 RepID=UPI002E13DF5A